MPFTATLLSQSDIDEVISDMRLIASGAELYFAVDAYEVVDFCFPVDIDSPRPKESRTIAGEQAALWEVFEKRPTRPILIPDYENEIHKHLTYVRALTGDVYRSIAMIDALLGEDIVDSPVTPDDSTEALLNMLETKFNLLLAGVMGMLSIGVDRFRKVLTDRLLRPRDFQDPQLKLAAESYRGTHLVTEIFHHLVRYLDNSRLPPDEIERRKRSAMNDARAVDWILHMNHALERAFIEKRMDRRILILYLSSAPRTERIFNFRFVRESFPLIAGRRHNPRRRRNHILEYLISRELDRDTPEDLENTVKNLEKQKEVLKRIEGFGISAAQADHHCETCTLEGGMGDDCPILELCREERKRMDKIPNLGLVAEVQEYEKLLNARPHSARHNELFAFFKEVLRRPNLPDLALARMKAIQNLVIAESTLAVNAESEIQPDQVNKVPAGPRIRYLPIKPKVPSKAYAELVDEIFEIPFRVPDQNARNYSTEYARLVEPIYDRFQALDRAKPNSGEHELVRCLTYMTFPDKQGDLVALEYARKKCADYPEYERDFMYIIAWVASRIQKYQDAHDSAGEAIHKWPQDPRFYHARSVNTIRWLMDPKYSKVCPLRYSHAIDDAQLAVDLSLSGGVPEASIIASNCNNIAYLRSQQPKAKEYNLKLARQALERLKEFVPETQWLPGHPEYVHTQAHLLVQEIRANLPAEKLQPERWIELDRSIELLDKAAGTLGKEVYQHTHSELLDLRKEFFARHAGGTL